MGTNLVQVVPEIPTNELEVHLVAVDAMQMASAQAKLTIWLQAKIADIDDELSELIQARDQARVHKWRISTFSNQIDRAEKRKAFYVKLYAAAEAGYTIIPNMPIDLLAVKVDEVVPSDTDRHTWTNGPMPASVLAQSPDSLPAGEGTYVSPVPSVSRHNTTAQDAQGKRYTEHHVRAIALKDMEFPVSVAIPSIMDATAKAMALKIFDQIGICPAKGLRARPDAHRTQQLPPSRDPDPLIIGQILSPKSGYSGGRPVSFLIAWHLDLRTL